jgi:hypothetical protein
MLSTIAPISLAGFEGRGVDVGAISPLSGDISAG